MKNNSIPKKIINYLRIAKTCMFEAKSIKDKFLLLEYYIKSPKHMLNHLKNKKNNRKLSSNIFIKNKYGLFFCGDNVSSVFGFSSINEPEVRKEINLTKGTFVDVGANGGMHSIPSGIKLKDNGQVISIEPEKRNFEILKKNIEINNLTNILPINKGCFSKKSKLKFYIDEIGMGGHSLIKKNNKFIEISVDTLDNILEENKIKDIKLIKIDVEGVEAEVLQGAQKTLKKYHPKIIFEAWDDSYFEKIKKVLESFNYKYKKISSQDYIAE